MSDHHDDDEEIDEEQLADYCTMLDKLGNFPVRFIFYLLLAVMSNRDFLVGVLSSGRIVHRINNISLTFSSVYFVLQLKKKVLLFATHIMHKIWCTTMS